MKIESSKYRGLYRYKISEPFGNFYIFDDYVISEINEGVHFNWELAEIVIEQVYDYFGSRDIKLSYISNRIHSYSLHPQDWLRFYQERHQLEAFAIVAYNKIGLMNVILEKLFSQTRIRKFRNLDVAIEWVSEIKIQDQEHSA
ncbi:MAG: hypothetical protein KJO05_01860 [Bacteroidia bacterium]|nr:hypothetical protein [Bacteroidia bacterium]MBT8276027.1 hypothetical protein [Bacteroidia bacterium]NNJ83197.1 hypothetical protein [Flavobacteriaceae bacterium]NNK53698.1 hypothetical protein [Flavobacteriaceae bacterium]NNM09281.1 hypothetical protein [Flavobacteriaceae bacterium]